MKIAIGCDEAAYRLKVEIMKRLDDIGIELAKSLIDVWLKCDFVGGDSAPKVARINEIDAQYHK